MSFREADIVHEIGRAWVLRERDRFTVYIAGVTHSVSDSAYPPTDDGKSIAIARANYLGKSCEKSLTRR